MVNFYVSQVCVAVVVVGRYSCFYKLFDSHYTHIHTHTHTHTQATTTLTLKNGCKQIMSEEKLRTMELFLFPSCVVVSNFLQEVNANVNVGSETSTRVSFVSFRVRNKKLKKFMKFFFFPFKLESPNCFASSSSHFHRTAAALNIYFPI